MAVKPVTRMSASSAAAATSPAHQDEVPIDAVPGRLRKTLLEKCTQCRDLSDAINSMTADKKELLREIGELAEANRLTRVRGNGWLMKKGHGKSSTIQANLLVEQGVPMAKIEKATVTKTWDFYQVLGGKDKNGKGEDE